MSVRRTPDQCRSPSPERPHYPLSWVMAWPSLAPKSGRISGCCGHSADRHRKNPSPGYAPLSVSPSQQGFSIGAPGEIRTRAPASGEPEDDDLA
jgi:hypothetical protein